MTNESSVEISKSQEGSYLFDHGGNRPICDAGKFYGVHLDSIFADDHPKIVDFCDIEGAFVEVQKKVVVFEFLQDLEGILL